MPLAPLVLLAALASGHANGPRGAQQPAQAPVKPLVTTAWLADHLGEPGIVIVQIESRPDRYARHIPGARLLLYGDIAVDGERDVGVEIPPIADLERALEAAGISDDGHIVIYSSTPLSSSRLWVTLDYIGHGDHASILDGGLDRWTAEGRALDDATPPAGPGQLTPKARPDVLVTAEWIHQRLDDPRMVLIDARPEDEYTGADGGMGGMTHPGHIPGAYRMYWEDLIASRGDPVLLDPAALRARFEAAGATQDRTIVAYCMVGMRASMTYFVARMLGYDVRFYDGSWHDWGTRDLPYVEGSTRR
jgi:thiosulfate/3-mercaptopyruvate sulfurtransferase